MLLPAITAIWGATKLGKKSAAERRTGKTMIKIAGVWAGLSLLTWGYAAYQYKKIANNMVDGPQAALPPERNKQDQMMKMLGLPKLG